MTAREHRKCRLKQYTLHTPSPYFLQLIDRFQAKAGYIQPPPPGCPKAIYKVMVQCW